MQRRRFTALASIPRRARASIASGLSSTWTAFVRPAPRWSVSVGRLEPSGDELVKAKLSGPRHYCDHCNVAHARFVIKWGDNHQYELALCGHHYHRHKFALAVRPGAVITELADES